MLQRPSSWLFLHNFENQRTRASFYSLSRIHTHCCIGNKVCSLATLCLWFPSHAALKLCFINSCIGVPAHSCFMNNSFRQAERREPNININTDKATFCHRPCVFVFFFLPQSYQLICVYLSYRETFLYTRVV